MQHFDAAHEQNVSLGQRPIRFKLKLLNLTAREDSSFYFNVSIYLTCTCTFHTFNSDLVPGTQELKVNEVLLPLKVKIFQFC